MNPFGANPTKWSNTLKQFVGKLPTYCLSVFDDFVRLANKGLNIGEKWVNIKIYAKCLLQYPKCNQDFPIKIFYFIILSTVSTIMTQLQSWTKQLAKR